MTYQWKVPLYKVTAQKAGEELERISGKGELTPAAVVDASRPSTAVLHNIFDWDDASAAEKCREVQASGIIRNLVTVQVENVKTNEPVRCFVRASGAYTDIASVMKTEISRQTLLDKALEELNAFRAKYQALGELAEVFDKLDALLSKKGA